VCRTSLQTSEIALRWTVNEWLSSTDKHSAALQITLNEIPQFKIMTEFELTEFSENFRYEFNTASNFLQRSLPYIMRNNYIVQIFM